mmetsp:Transcript_47153/g.102624  ORF Transcript_47153/g.102624 Transcript_47153/m.102624 type:complete len:250 (+) Transcript_47153:1849-2598(+)
MSSTTFSTPSSGTDEATGSSPSSGLAAASSLSVFGKEMYPTEIPWETLSTTSNSRTLNMGLSMAACRQHPRATASSAFKVRLSCSGCKPNLAPTRRWKNGTRLAPPTISTVLISSTGIGAPSTALSNTAWILLIMGSHIFSKSSLLILALRSSSFINISTLAVASKLALRIFLALVAVSSSLNLALRSDSGSHLYFCWKAAAKFSIRHLSMSRPPQLLSLAAETSSSLLFENFTMQTEKVECPMEAKAT